MKDDFFLYQHKWTSKASHSIKLEELDTLRMNAIDENKSPVYIIDFNGKIWYLIDEGDFGRLKEDYELNGTTEHI